MGPHYTERYLSQTVKVRLSNVVSKIPVFLTSHWKDFVYLRNILCRMDVCISVECINIAEIGIDLYYVLGFNKIVSFWLNGSKQKVYRRTIAGRRKCTGRQICE